MWCSDRDDGDDGCGVVTDDSGDGCGVVFLLLSSSLHDPNLEREEGGHHELSIGTKEILLMRMYQFLADAFLRFVLPGRDESSYKLVCLVLVP